MRRVLFVAVVLCILCSVLVTAVNVDINVFPDQRTFKANESASFELEIKTDSPQEEIVEVYSTDVLWDVRAEAQLKVAAGETLKTNVIITPLNLNPGSYNIPLDFKRTGSQEVQRKSVHVELQSPIPSDASYLPGVRGVVSIEPQIDPRENVTVKLSLENQNMRTLDRVDVRVRSNVINKDYSTTLGPLEKKTLKFIANIDPKTSPQKDGLRISILVPEKDKTYSFELLPVSYEIIQYGYVVPTVVSEKSFLRRTDNITLHSDSNKNLGHVYRVPTWFGKRWFMTADPRPMLQDGELVWDVAIDPGSSVNIVLVYNYRPLFWIFLVIVVVLGAYFVFRSPLRVEKRAVVVKTHEGGITELKVIIELVNRSGKIVRHVKVLDLVPHLAEVVQEFSGTVLAPSKIMPNESRGTLVRWDIDMMEQKEHRILMYRLRTKLGVLGGLTLPVTAVHFAIDGHGRETSSNKPEIRYRS